MPEKTQIEPLRVRCEHDATSVKHRVCLLVAGLRERFLRQVRSMQVQEA